MTRRVAAQFKDVDRAETSLRLCGRTVEEVAAYERAMLVERASEQYLRERTE